MRTFGSLLATGLAALTAVQAGEYHRKPEPKTTLTTVHVPDGVSRPPFPSKPHHTNVSHDLLPVGRQTDDQQKPTSTPDIFPYSPHGPGGLHEPESTPKLVIKDEAFAVANTDSTVNALEGSYTLQDSNGPNALQDTHIVNTLDDSYTANALQDNHAPNALQDSNLVNALEDSNTANALQGAYTPNALQDRNARNALQDANAANSLQGSYTPNGLQDSSGASALQDSSSSNGLQDSSATNALQDSHTVNSLQDAYTPNALQGSSSPNVLQDSSAANSLQDSNPSAALQDSYAPNGLQDSHAPTQNDIPTLKDPSPFHMKARRSSRIHARQDSASSADKVKPDPIFPFPEGPAGYNTPKSTPISVSHFLGPNGPAGFTPSTTYVYTHPTSPPEALKTSPPRPGPSSAKVVTSLLKSAPASPTRTPT